MDRQQQPPSCCPRPPHVEVHWTEGPHLAPEEWRRLLELIFKPRPGQLPPEAPKKA
ncbi:hypothetical protein [Streptomyces sp. NBC_01760]|uniref:hypothetical protein n=1 Tax=Streptomyces sp. NBC_01760 TaxID=2975931 RepID=UPI002DDC09E9|nr:hypothetical protein [Streptomyces sp. NBC_01760]WSC72244.1 hypothetical protein OG807_29260 [Streptomyces sp. NBC_01760]